MSLYRYEIDSQGLDLSLCLRVGQVFRWSYDERTRTATGADGEAAFVVQEDGGDWAVCSNAPESRFRSLFGLEGRTAEENRRLLALDPALKPALEATSAVAMMRQEGCEEVFFSFLCTSNNHISRISSMVRWLEAQGEPMADLHGKAFMRFPGAERLAKVSEAEYRSAGFGYRGATLPLAAKMLTELGGREWLKGLASRQHEEARRELIRIPGIGPKLADCICLFGLHQGEAVPVDTHFWRAGCEHAVPEWIGTPISEPKAAALRAEFVRRYGALAGRAHHVLFVARLLNRL